MINVATDLPPHTTPSPTPPSLPALPCNLDCTEPSTLSEVTCCHSWTEQAITINPGSAVAALWIRTSLDNHPPISVPRPVLPVQTCPRCHHSLSAPLHPSGLQTCAHCNWVG
ncbi:hypothetical protein [Thermocoleostomius sinensis]|uniref:Uncharacterized protein n=1 Tax=Thermocoleostomius sinensis A174 TaxID=2016057 RepID=A0A9E8ZEP0_9CYAN|nr:hypothetical protein [Thermocoleostomius sinensis]WAL60432.1 hypothetical protein OXH18_00110 [Thermocoleostomius sinensis A174]